MKTTIPLHDAGTCKKFVASVCFTVRFGGFFPPRVFILCLWVFLGGMMGGIVRKFLEKSTNMLTKVKIKNTSWGCQIPTKESIG